MYMYVHLPLTFHNPCFSQLTVTLILCLRDWLMALPIQQMAKEGSLSPLVLKTVFEVRVFAMVTHILLHSQHFSEISFFISHFISQQSKCYDEVSNSVSVPGIDWLAVGEVWCSVQYVEHYAVSLYMSCVIA